MNQETSGHVGPAILHGQDHLPLSTGTAFFDVSGVSGRFEPSDPSQGNQDDWPHTPRFLTAKKREYRLAYFAAREHKLDLAELLLKHGAAVDAQDCDRNTPLSRAVFAQSEIDAGGPVRGRCQALPPPTMA